MNITVNAINDNPNAVNDTFNTNEDTALNNINVLSNDSDIDGNALIIDSVTQASNGIVSINPDNTLNYIPNANYNGLDSFTYTVSDGQGAFSTATVNITVNPINDIPIVSLDTVFNIDPNIVGKNTNWTAVATGSDIDGSISNYHFWIDLNNDGDYNDTLNNTTVENIQVLNTNASLSNTDTKVAGSGTEDSVVLDIIGTLSNTDFGSYGSPYYDDYEIIIPIGASFEIRQDGITFSDTYLFLIDKDTNQLITENDDYNGYDSQINYTNNTGAEINAIIRASSYSAGEIGDYTLKATYLNAPGISYIDESEIIIKAGETITINQDSTDFDTKLSLIDKSNSQLLSSNDNYNGSNSQITYTNTTNSDIVATIRAGSAMDSTTGNYTLKVSQTETKSTMVSEDFGISANGTLNITNDLNQLGLLNYSDYNMKVIATDNLGAESNPVIAIFTTPDAPIIAGDLNATVNEDGRYILTTNDLSVIDSDSTSFTYATFAATNVTLQIWNGSEWVNGTTFTQAQLMAGEVSFVQDGSENSTASFIVNVNDGALTSANSTFNINTNLLNEFDSSDFLVSTTNTNNQLRPEITGLTNGGFVATWADRSNGNHDTRGRVFNADGTPVNASDFSVSTSTIIYQHQPQITSLSNGGFVSTWEDSSSGNYNIRGRVFNADGTPVNASDFLVSTSNTNDQLRPKITSLSNGGFVATWASNNTGNYDVRGRVFNADGTAVNATDFLVSTSNTNTQYFPQITSLSNGGFVATWESDNTGNSDIRARVFNASGTPAANDFLVSTSNSGHQYSAQITTLSNGGFAVSWTDGSSGNNDIRGRVFNADGTPVNASDFVVSTSNTNHQHSSRITSLSNGGFAVSWTDGGMGGNNDIRGRVFNANGTPVNPSDFLVSTTKNGNDDVSSEITSLSNGGFAVTWQDGMFGYGYDTRVRVFDSTGTAVNASDFLAPTTINDDQENPQITSLSNGGFVATWEDYSNGTDYDIRARVFDNEGNGLYNGTTGNDVFVSSNLNETVTGQAGNDFYVFRGAFGNDTIDDTSGIERIDLMDYASADYFTRTEGRTTGDNLVITLAGGGTITIVNYFDETGTAAGTGYIETIDFWNTQNITITTLINNGWI